MRTRPTSATDELHCDFCGKGEHEVSRLIAGQPRVAVARVPAGPGETGSANRLLPTPYYVGICGECVEMSQEVLAQGDEVESEL